LEKSFTRSWLSRQSLPCFICLAKSYPKHQKTTTMENLTLKIRQTTTKTVIIPRYFLRSTGDYYKLINEKTYINVVYYGDDLLQYNLYLYPKIVVYSTDLLQGLDVMTLKQITEDEFFTAYYEAKNLIEKLAEI
jgi:hypothetical protein